MPSLTILRGSEGVWAINAFLSDGYCSEDIVVVFRAGDGKEVAKKEDAMCLTSRLDLPRQRLQTQLESSRLD